MKVLVSGYAWLDANELSDQQKSNIRTLLTIHPSRTSEHEKKDPPPIALYVEDDERNLFGVPRSFYLEKRSEKHDETLKVSDGVSMKAFDSLMRFEGEYAEQEVAIEFLYDLLTKQTFGGSILKAGCGTGKTNMALALAHKFGVRTLILVHKEFLMNQWRRRIEEFFPDARVGIIRQSKCQFRDVDFSIAMLDSITSRRDKYPEAFYKTAFGLVITDECVDGEALVDTDEGQIPLKEVVRGRSEYVLSFCGTTGEWEKKRILRRMDRGRKRTVLVRTSGVSLRVTSEHLLMTRRGWVEARELKPGDMLVAPVDAVRRSLHSTGKGAQEDTSLGIKFGPGLTGSKEQQRSTLRLPCVPADVESECLSVSRLSRDIVSRTCVGEVGCVDTTPGKRSLIRLTERSVWSWVRCLVTAVFPFLTTDPSLQDSRSITVPDKKSGLGSKAWRCLHSVCRSQRLRTLAMAESLFVVLRCVIRSWLRFTDSCTPTVESLCLSSVSIDFRSSRWRGGTSMTEVLVRGIRFGFTPKDIESVKFGCWLNGSWVGDTDARSIDLSRSTGSSGWIPNLAEALFRRCVGRQRFQPAWHTKFFCVEGVSTAEEVHVYDLEVEDNHNFVADGVLVHNCHRVGAQTWAPIIPMFSARYRLGLTATPRRKDDAEEVFFKHIGPIGYAARTRPSLPALRKIITDVELRGKMDHGKIKKAIDLGRSEIVTQLSKIPERTRQIMEDVFQGVKRGRKLLVLSERLDHLKEMAGDLNSLLSQVDLPFIPTIDFYVGEWFTGETNEVGELLMVKVGKGRNAKWRPKTKRRTEDELRKAEGANVIFATIQMVSEGLDIQALDVLVLGTPISDVEQAAGRVRRRCYPEDSKCRRLCPWRAGVCDGKPQPIITDVVDECVPQVKGKWKARARFYRREGML